MFTDGMKESKQEVIELKDESISPDALKIVMDSIYTGDLHVNEENVFEVLAAADYLQVTSVVQQCCDFLLIEFLQLRVDVQTYCRVWTIADRHGLRDLQDAAEKKMASMYKDVCESEEFLSRIGADQLISLLRRDDLSAPSETFVFKSVMQWIKHKKEERMAVAAKVIGAVRLGLVDIGVLVEELNTQEMKRDPETYTLVYESFLHKYMPLNSSKFAEEKAKPRSMSPVLVAILPQTQMQYFDVESKNWKPLPSMTQLTEATACFCAEYVGNNLYVAAKKGDSLFDFVNYRYHTVNNSWETLPPLLSNFGDIRQINSLCSVDNYLYGICGGLACVPYRYSPAKNNWQGGANLGFGNPLTDQLSNAVAAVWKSHIYVLHGHKRKIESSAPIAKPVTTGMFRQPSMPCNTAAFGILASGENVAWSNKVSVVHCFDLEKNKWKQKASTCHPHINSSLFVVNNRLYVAGGYIDSELTAFGSSSAPVEVYDEENNTWSVVEQKHIPPNNLGAVEIEGRVYFIVNKFPVDVGVRVPPGEVYHVCLNEWKNLAQINKDAVLCYMPVKTESFKAD